MTCIPNIHCASRKNATFNTYNSAGRDHVLALWCCRYWYDLSSHDEYAPAFSGGDSRGDAAIVVVMVEIAAAVVVVSRWLWW